MTVKFDMVHAPETGQGFSYCSRLKCVSTLTQSLIWPVEKDLHGKSSTQGGGQSQQSGVLSPDCSHYSLLAERVRMKRI